MRLLRNIQGEQLHQNLLNSLRSPFCVPLLCFGCGKQIGWIINNQCDHLMFCDQCKREVDSTPPEEPKSYTKAETASVVMELVRRVNAENSD